ncbi:MAG TPA: hypothetical protein VKR38_09155 [Usitatibacter sp.]|nr:hypothetical protein [Usitatibacter sp.]
MDSELKAISNVLNEGLDEIGDLTPYRLDPPRGASCIKGGFEIEVVVYAEHANTAFFISVDAGQFGVGTTNEYGDIVESNHYPNITMALRSFLGAVREPRQ